MTAFLQISPLMTFWTTLLLSLLVGMLLGFLICWLGRKRYFERRVNERSNGLIDSKNREIEELRKLFNQKKSRIEDLEATHKGVDSDLAKSIDALRRIQKELNTRPMNKE